MNVSYYASITTDDSNFVKRLVQRRRLAHSLRVLKTLPQDFAGAVLDYGAGTGLLCEQLASRFPQASVVCFEPVPSLCEEAASNLAPYENAEVVSQLPAILDRRFDYLFCLEVLEHLPQLETDNLLDSIETLSADGATAIFGVPNELYAAALVKGLFRYQRRRGSFDTRWSYIWQAVLGRPPQQRPMSEIWPGLRYHYHHLGFDYRNLRETLARRFDVTAVYGSPMTFLPIALNSEVYFVCRERQAPPVPSPHCEISHSAASV